MILYAVSPNVVLRHGKYTAVHQLPSFLVQGESAESAQRKIEDMIRDLAGERYISCDATPVAYREEW